MLSKKILNAALLGLLSGIAACAHAAESKMDTSPSQQAVPVGKGGMKIGQEARAPGASASGASGSLGAASDAETSRIARLKKQISDGQNANPALDKLGPYLGKGY